MRSSADGFVLIISTDGLGVNGAATWGSRLPDLAFRNAIPVGEAPLTGVLVNYRTWRALPLQPLWSGLALNICAYLAVLVTVVLCVRLVRAGFRKRRRACGLCEKCAHPLENLPTCPECGTPRMPARTATPAS